MKTLQFHNLLRIMLIALSLLPITGSVIAGEELFFICNKNVSENELSKAEVINVFLGKKTVWGDQQPITICLFEGKRDHNIFTRQYLNRSPLQYKRFWRTMVFTGKGIFPKSFNNKDRLVEFIAETDGAIGYSSSEVDKNGIKTISTIN